MIKIEPTHDNVLVLLDKNPNQTDSGIALPQTADIREKHKTGKVLAVGPGREDYFIDATSSTHERVRSLAPCAVGDRVILKPYSFTETLGILKSEGDIAIVSGHEIVAVIKE